MKRLTLEEIEAERQVILRRSRRDGARITELNTQRQNIIMSQED